LLSLLDKRLRRNVGKKASTCYLAFAVATVFSLDNSFNGINVSLELLYCLYQTFFGI
jgi:hypothetical protein